MARNRGVSLLWLLLLLGGALANDVVMEFLALDCHSRPVSGVSVKLEGCVLPQDNEGRDSTAVIDANGMAGFYCHPMVVQYCYGSAAQLCSWTATKGSEVYLDDIQTLVNQMAAHPNPITPHAFSGCKCDGSDECEPVVHYPLIVLKRSDCPCSGTFRPSNSEPQGSGPTINSVTEPLLPSPQCLAICSVDLIDGTTRTGACSSSLPGAGSGQLPGRRLLGADSGSSCPDGYLDTQVRCSPAACGVCCVPFHIDFHTNNPYA